MEACQNAGIINENNADKSLFFALEPETTLLYCFRNDSISKDHIKKG